MSEDHEKIMEITMSKKDIMELIDKKIFEKQLFIHKIRIIYEPPKKRVTKDAGKAKIEDT